MRIKKFSDFIILEEKTIGSENIRSKWYPDMDKHLFYKLVNIDPTSIRKKDFSKPGKYTKWLIREYKAGNLTNDELNNLEYTKKLNYCLFIFSTGWYKNRHKGTKKLDINNFISGELLKAMSRYIIEEYESDTEKSKFDVVYADSKIDILVPINFTASRETAKNTEWCSQSYIGFSIWNKASIMFRIIPKNKNYDKLKLTWSKNNEKWYLACSKYPEISGDGSPFYIENNKEYWQIEKEQRDNVDTTSIWKENSDKIEKTMRLISDEAKKYIEMYYEKHHQ